MTTYDPLNPMPKSEWLALDEQERHDAVEQFHRRRKETPPSLSAHVAIHVVIENQLADGINCVERAITRLIGEGLDRHDSIHAVGSVLTEQMSEMLRQQTKFDLVSYAKALDTLSADTWLKGE